MTCMIYESDFHVMLLSNAELVLSFPASTISSPFISVSHGLLMQVK